MFYFVITCAVLVIIIIVLFLAILTMDWLDDKNRQMEIKQLEKDWLEENNGK